MRRAYTGPTWRHVPAGAHPLNLQFLLQAGGRWNRLLLTGRTVGLLAIPPERLESDEPEDLEACRELADWARGQEFLALLVSSAAAPERTNLVIFPENRPREISLRETSVRVALNYGPDPFLDEAGRPTRKEP